MSRQVSSIIGYPFRRNDFAYLEMHHWPMEGITKASTFARYNEREQHQQCGVYERQRDNTNIKQYPDTH